MVVVFNEPLEHQWKNLIHYRQHRRVLLVKQLQQQFHEIEQLGSALGDYFPEHSDSGTPVEVQTLTVADLSVTHLELLQQSRQHFLVSLLVGKQLFYASLVFLHL